VKMMPNEKKYIDAENIKKSINEYFTPIDSNHPMTLTVEQVMEAVGNMPVADVMEAKHGEWLTRKDYEDNYQTYACSICDNSCVTSHNEDDTVTLYRTKYCPNCGAKMDKGV